MNQYLDSQWFGELQAMLALIFGIKLRLIVVTDASM